MPTLTHNFDAWLGLPPLVTAVANFAGAVETVADAGDWVRANGDECLAMWDAESRTFHLYVTGEGVPPQVDTFRLGEL